MPCDALRCVAGGWLGLASVSGLAVPWCDAMAVRVSCRGLYLFGNQLTGSIPSTLGNLTALS